METGAYQLNGGNESAINEAGTQVLPTHCAPLTYDTEKGASDMPVMAIISTRAESASNSNWKSIGDLAAALVEKAVSK